MSKAPAKDGSNFRARRLSVSDIDTSEFAAAGGSTPSGSKGKPKRRMSMSPEMGEKKAADAPFPLDIVGTFSCHGVEPGHKQGETMAKINQDRGCMSYPFACDDKDYKQTLFCVFDGHGAVGDKVS